MYSNIRSVQILISLMKNKGIHYVILSPGGSDIPLIHSIETDNFFTCYSVVDERSAVYFAMGLAQSKGTIVACICTSGSAVCNYLPGISEAYYQNVPILAITADKNPYYQGQLETQKIEQIAMFKGVVKKNIDLPLINNSEDEWLCNRLINEALLALTHHGTGPVHINIPVVGNTNIYDCVNLPKERYIQLIDLHSNNEIWNMYAKKLSKNKKIMIVVGQNIVFTPQTKKIMEAFFEKYDCIFSVEHLSNYDGEGAVYTYPLTEMCGNRIMNELIPDVVISVGNNLSSYNLKPFFRANYKKIDNWLITESGEIRDAYKCLTNIFECTVSEFFEKLVYFADDEITNKGAYYYQWQTALQSIKWEKIDFSNFYVAQELSKIIPENSIIHLAVLSSVRIMQFFKLAKGIKTYSNVGTLGIDGCFSTFAGLAAGTNQLAFLLIGDLSFFYDMNAAGLRSISSNVRIILLNNGGGSEFHFFMGKDKIPTIDSYICAKHNKKAEGWIRSLGYEYYAVTTKSEFDRVITKFAQPSEQPMFLEVFTDMEEDANKLKQIYMTNNTDKSTGIKKIIKTSLSDKNVRKIKTIVQLIKK